MRADPTVDLTNYGGPLHACKACFASSALFERHRPTLAASLRLRSSSEPPPQTMRITQFLPLILCSAILIPFGAKAQTDSSTTLTRDELRVCMLHETHIRGRSEAHQSELARSNEEAASIAAENANLIRASVNGFKDKAARDLHIAKSNSLNRRVEAFNAKSKQIRLALADIQTAQSEYLRKCGGKSFYQEDKEAILAERATGKGGAKAPDQPASATQSN